MSCLFCRIVAGEIPATIAYQDEHILAFHDITPQAPTHLLIIPKTHIASVLDVGVGQAPLMGHLFQTVQHLAKEFNLEASGFRLVTNSGPDAGQSVFHLHFHLLGGRSLDWPPG